MEDRIEIPLSKTKLLLLLLGGIGFVVLGTWFTIHPEQFKTPLFQSSEVIRMSGIASIVFFGVCVVFIFKKLFDKKVGLIMDENGITDHSSGTSVGLIEWDDIIGLETVQVASTKIMMLLTNQPEKYIARAKNGIAKQAMKANYKMYGSPLSIASNSLQITYDDLEKLITKVLDERK
ncbi:hypothetical protein SAMN05216480_11259 [Pustulibacterium marinum]|uniref:Uncharacterized protein n=1 Tax=Pustulibacterium marinum TaxID=1224947 RepID=A0A1I7I1E1_9FLAO|nr:STM3941 family protein [Pustulibacterium marinum]SFU66735.1 hypothetical protein SAMN05216480_11259 [Pustulibacterium marinum]